MRNLSEVRCNKAQVVISMGLQKQRTQRQVVRLSTVCRAQVLLLDFNALHLFISKVQVPAKLYIGTGLFELCF